MADLMDLNMNVDYFGLKAEVSLMVRYTDVGDYEIERVTLESLTNRNDPLETVRVAMDVRDVSDFYSEHGDRIDEIIAAEIAESEEAQREWAEDMAYEAAEERQFHARNLDWGRTA